MARLPTLKPRLQVAKTKPRIDQVQRGTARLYGNTWQRIRQQVLREGEYTCAKCGRVSMFEMEVDHIIPLSKGGLHVESNLRCACRKCNGLKSDRVYQLI